MNHNLPILCLIFFFTIRMSVYASPMNKPPEALPGAPVNFVARLFEKANLTCPFSPTARNIYYRWTFEDDGNTLSSERVYSFKPSAIEGVQTFKCKAINGFGTTVVTIKLRIMGKPTFENQCIGPTLSWGYLGPCFMMDIPNNHQILTVKAKSFVTLNCETGISHEAVMQPAYFWEFSGINSKLTLSERQSPIVNLTDLKTTDSGQYTCTVTSKGRSMKRVFELVVTDNNGRRIVGPVKENLTVEEGTSQTLVCKTKRNMGKPKFMWAYKIDSSMKSSYRSDEIIQYDDQSFVYGKPKQPEKLSEDGSAYVSEYYIQSISMDNLNVYVCSVVYNNPIYTEFKYFNINVRRANDNKSLAVIYAAVPGFIILILIGVMLYCICRRNQSQESRSRYSPTPLQTTGSAHSEYPPQQNNYQRVPTNGNSHLPRGPVKVTTGSDHSKNGQAPNGSGNNNNSLSPSSYNSEQHNFQSVNYPPSQAYPSMGYVTQSEATSSPPVYYTSGNYNETPPAGYNGYSNQNNPNGYYT